MHRYFKGGADVGRGNSLFRIPDNGKDICEQESEAVEMFWPEGWRGGYDMTLSMWAMQGEFSEESDEINELEAIALMAEVVKRTKQDAK
jgi:hypothetical protein